MGNKEPEVIAETKNGVRVAAWLLKCNPAVFNVAAAVAAEGGKVRDWRLADNYRWGLMSPGDRCYLWVTGARPSPVPAGVYAAGTIDGSVRPNRGGGPFWGDLAEKAKRRPYVDCDLAWLSQPILREDLLLLHPAFAGAEVVRVKQMGNPNILTPAEVAVLESFPLARGPVASPTLDAFAEAHHH